MLIAPPHLRRTRGRDVGRVTGLPMVLNSMLHGAWLRAVKALQGGRNWCSGRRALLTIATGIFPLAAIAQPIACHIPAALPDMQTESVPPGEQRIVTVTRYTLALSWSPEFCQSRKGQARFAMQCGGADDFGFILHGLWPEGAGNVHPAWCRPAAPLPAALVRQNLCAMPGVALMQHEWAKHGTCASNDPAQYFGAATRLYGGLRWPDMNKLSRSPQTALSLATMFSAVNAGLTTDMIKVKTSRKAWLEAVLLCLNTNLRAVRCPANMEGAAARDPVKIWRIRK
jgi:ribonuclease T2